MKIFYILILSIIFFTGNQNAKEILIYADNIRYDSKKNIIASGNAKVIKDNEIIISELIIYNAEKKEFILPKEFSYKDEVNNYYLGSSGYFDENITDGLINDVKMLLNDGTRIVGTKAIKKDHIDIISKAVYTQCKSKVNIKDFKCPIWQLEGEKFLHDNKKLFLYQKHTKMKIFNIPVFYFPYLVTPSPLRKKRKSGFLTPKLSFLFIDAQTSQDAAFPYYFNIDIDKELTLTPIIRYGGGVDSSQRFVFDYNQILSGGSLTTDLSIDTNVENQNNETWFKDGSLVTNYNQNINENYNININSAFQTRRTYIRETDKESSKVNDASLATTIDLNRYGIFKYDDKLRINMSTYQVVKRGQDNSLTPTVLPFMEYTYRNFFNKDTKYENNIQTYNIYRDKNTEDHAKKQQKFSLNNNIDYKSYRYNSKINLRSEIHAQYFSTEDKLVKNIIVSNENYRIFPMSGIFIETPVKHKKKNLLITPKISMIINDSKANTNEISNEDSSYMSTNSSSQNNLNRYSGTDRLDNSKRIYYGLELSTTMFTSKISQNYEIDLESDYNKENSNTENFSDAYFENGLTYKLTSLNHSLRYSPQLEKIRSQSLGATNKNVLGIFGISYLDEKKESNSMLIKGNEVLTFDYTSAKIKKYSEIKINTKQDLIDDQLDEYSIFYEYFDECFGANLEFSRKIYHDEGLKPEDTLTLLFSFKNLGAYQSTNLAVSEWDKQDIQFEETKVTNEKFK